MTHEDAKNAEIALAGKCLNSQAKRKTMRDLDVCVEALTGYRERIKRGDHAKRPDFIEISRLLGVVCDCVDDIYSEL